MRRVDNIFRKQNPSLANSKDLAMPLAVKLFKKCIEFNIQDCLLQRLHFYDLYVLILSLDITKYKQAIHNNKSAKSRNTNNVRDISQADAVKFLTGGG